MRTVVFLALMSMWGRRVSVGLTVLSIACSVLLLLGVERVRSQARSSFVNAVSGTDLIVGARGSGTQILLSSVFHMGYPTKNIRAATVDALVARDEVEWVIPLSLGDSHRGYRVVGTTGAFLAYYGYGDQQSLALRVGDWFSEDTEAVVGAELAARLKYEPGTTVVVSHGAGEVNFVNHDNHPFTVVGVLEPTGTPVDRLVLVSLDGIKAMHAGFYTEDVPEDPLAEFLVEEEAHQHVHHEGCAHHGSGMCTFTEDHELSALLVGLHAPTEVLGTQRWLNEWEGDALTAVMPGVALEDLWAVMGTVERLLLFVGGFVVLVGFIGMLLSLLAGLNERRREIAVLRSVGAGKKQVQGLLVSEAFLTTVGGVVFGLAGLTLLQLLAASWLQVRYGIYTSTLVPGPFEWKLMTGVLGIGFLVGWIPAWLAYRRALTDGLTPKA